MAKKVFKIDENPALAFISGKGMQQIDNTYNATPQIVSENETKSKRLNLLLYPSLLENLKKIAAMQRTSVNDLINTVLGGYAEKEIAQIEHYDQTFEE